LLKDYPDYGHLDEVLFRLGECQILVGRTAEALPHLSQLVNDYPKSEFVAEAQKLIETASSRSAVPAPAPSPSPEPSPSPSPAAPGTRP
jgi:hypothetical protein